MYRPAALIRCSWLFSSGSRRCNQIFPPRKLQAPSSKLQAPSSKLQAPSLQPARFAVENIGSARVASRSARSGMVSATRPALLEKLAHRCCPAALMDTFFASLNTTTAFVRRVSTTTPFAKPQSVPPGQRTQSPLSPDEYQRTLPQPSGRATPPFLVDLSPDEKRSLSDGRRGT